MSGNADYWAKRFLDANKRAETAERERDNLRSKLAKQKNELHRLTQSCEQLYAEKAALLADLRKARGA